MISLNQMKKLNKRKGFTLIEILVVIGIIAILAAIVIIAINPAKQFAQARNTQRQAGVNTILNAIGQRLADNKGQFLATTTCNALPINTPESPIHDAGTTMVSGIINLSCLAPTYVAALPTDPDSTIVAPDIGYTVSVNGTGRVTVCAPKSSGESAIPEVTEICVTR